MVAQKIQVLVGEGKADSSWVYFSFPFPHKTRLHCAEMKANVYGDWAMQHLNVKIVRVYCICVYY